MVDEFCPENGATRFVPGTHRWPGSPEGGESELRNDRDDQDLGCGPAGSLLIFNGSAWHGHTANTTDGPRRSIHGSFIPRTGKSATDFGVRMTPGTRARLSPLALELLSV
jgi:ectoine hydroxylase-related dioxygenase (phytanoyl-CoA dioxygenase family)